MNSIEPLEARIAPAAVFVNTKTATYNDKDGDHVTVKFTKPVLTAGNVATVFTFNMTGYLADLDLTGTVSPDGTGITFTVAKVAAGDGVVNVGAIDVTGHDIGAVKLPGDLGKIVAGDNTSTTAGVKSLTVNSLGRFSLDTGAADLHTLIQGSLNSLSVKGDVKDVYLEVSSGSIVSASIGGSLVGGSANSSGAIYGNQGIGTLKIGGNIEGGAGEESGKVSTNGDIGTITVGGSVLGGSGNFFTGSIFAQFKIGTMKIGHNVEGGAGVKSGTLFGGHIGTLSIGGSFIGGTAETAGWVQAAVIDKLTIGGDLIGGSIAGTTPTLDYAGFIDSNHFGSVKIGGSIIAGFDNSTAGSLTHNGGIAAFDDIGSLTVGGSIVGHITDNGISRVEISARGQKTLVAGKGDVAIGSITVGGRVEQAEILGGFDISLSPNNADAQIGTVKVGGDWMGSSLVAGVQRGPIGFGFVDTIAAGGSAALFSKLASITIGGQVLGTPQSLLPLDSFGFAAQEVGALKIGGHAITLHAGRHNDTFLVNPAIIEVQVHEIF